MKPRINYLIFIIRIYLKKHGYSSAIIDLIKNYATPKFIESLSYSLGYITAPEGKPFIEKLATDGIFNFSSGIWAAAENGKWDMVTWLVDLAERLGIKSIDFTEAVSFAITNENVQEDLNRLDYYISHGAPIELAFEYARDFSRNPRLLEMLRLKYGN